jgi:YVTN family beta-propeller protein
VSGVLRRAFLGAVTLSAVSATVLSGCTSGRAPASGAAATSAGPATSSTATGPTSPRASATTPAAVNVYAHDGAGKVQGAARTAKALVYVPNTLSNTLQVIDPRTYKVVARYPTGHEPQHVVPSWDLKTLWVNDDLGNDLVPVNPRTGVPGPKVPVADPYNLYFTPDGAHALVMAERLHRIDVRNPRTMALQRSLHVPCDGINHADYSADQSFFVASCEFSGKLLVVDKAATRIRKILNLNTIHTPGATTPMQAMHMPGPQSGLRPGASAMPQDVRLTPDGTHFLAADMLRNGIWVIDAHTLKVQRFLPTGKGTHSIYPDRTARRLFVANRDAGTITVLDATTLRTLHTWHLPGGGSPDMGGVSSDGRTLWLSGRYDSVVYVLDTTTGRLLKKIPVDDGPHGLCVWPQPGRYSLGHTGNMR